MVTKYLTDGGIPRDWTVQNLSWLAKTHRDRATLKNTTHRDDRGFWHLRWATLIEDLLESRLVQS